MGGWTGQNKDTIIWDGTLRSKNLIANAITADNIKFDHAAEKTPGHNVLFDNTLQGISAEFSNIVAIGGAGMAINISSGQIASETGAISFVNENLSTTGDFNVKDITASGNIHANTFTDIGIGQHPSRNVHVRYSSASGVLTGLPTISVENSNTVGFSFASMELTGKNRAIVGEFFADGSGLFRGGAHNLYFRTATSSPILFGTNLTVRTCLEAGGNMRIFNSLKVGADSAPTAALDVAGEAIVNNKIKMTSIGGYAIKLTNETGAASVAGETVKASVGTADACDATAGGELQCIGIFLDSGVAEHAEAWVVISGIADVKADGVGWALGDRIVTSGTARRAVANNNPAVAVHFQEIGHAVEAAGANALGRVVLHFL